MSKLACHVQKFQKSDVRGMQIHNQRESENSKNQEINRERTHLNYDLKNGQPINYTEAVKEKIAVLGDKTIRKDAVVLASVLVTADNEFFKDMPMEQQKNFFQAANQYLEGKFGKDNVVASVVHMDEKTPHLHFQFVPLTNDNRLCAKELTSRKNLTEIQNDLPKALQHAGFAIERGKEKSPAKHINTADWKCEQAATTLQLEAKEREFEAKSKLLTAKEQELADKHKSIDKELADADQRLANAKSTGELLQINARAQLKNPVFGTQHIDLSVSDYNTLWNTASAGAKAIEENQILKEKAVEVPSLKQANGHLTGQNYELSREVKNLTKTVEQMANRTYRRYQGRGLDDKQAAITMMKYDGIKQSDTGKVIARNSPSAPSRSNEAKTYANRVIADALKMDNMAVALAVQLGNQDEEIDWSALTTDQVRSKIIELDQGNN